ncbi:MAG: mevalonate kinase, partial [Gammaproteobacteria bacterium]|nr:mevalonate kinase [Gammaproteobacteria bacterium]
MLKIKAPGKLILSGEHAVVHGHPALVMAVNRYVELEITSHTSSDIFFNLADLNYQQLLSLNSVEQLYLKVKKNYLLFKENTLGVKSILETPPELALFTLGILLQNYSNQFSSGIKIKVKSSIPLSSGMGSSAA